MSDLPVDLRGDGVHCVLRAGLVHDESLAGRKLADFPWVTCATPAYLARHGTPLHPDELNTEGHVILPYFSVRSGELHPLHFRRGDQVRAIRARHRLAVGDGSAYLQAGLAGLGVMQAMQFMVARQLASGELVSLLETWRRDPLALYALYPRDRRVSAPAPVHRLGRRAVRAIWPGGPAAADCFAREKEFARRARLTRAPRLLPCSQSATRRPSIDPRRAA